MKKIHIINQTKENVTAKVKTFFAILAKMEWLSFILFGPSLSLSAVSFWLPMVGTTQRKRY